MRIGINGMGRIGRLALRAGFGGLFRPPEDPRGGNRLDVMHINELKGNAATAAHLLEFDSVHGRWRNRVSAARTKTEACRLADDLERKTERQRLGLEATPPVDGGGTLSELLEWWLATYSRGSPSHDRNGYSVRKQLIGSKLASIRLVDLKPGHIETLLQEKGRILAPQTVNHLRRYILTAFNCAKRAGRFEGVNPAAEVRNRKVPRRPPQFLRADEVPLVLQALAPRWRPLFALRRGHHRWKSLQPFSLYPTAASMAWLRFG